MIISLIAAMGENRVIGKNNTLPWDMPSDMQRFRTLTRDKPVIMGRATHISIGRPLPHRTNIVLTRQPDFLTKGCVVVHSVHDALAAARDAKEVMIIGGGSIYEQFLPLAHRMYLTIIHAPFEGDAFFPDYDVRIWKEIERTDFPADDQNPHPYTFITLGRTAI